MAVAMLTPSMPRFRKMRRMMKLDDEGYVSKK